MRTKTDPMRIEDLAARAPASRDRYVDLLRALSILAVVVGHWIAAVVYLRDGRVSGDNALGVVPGAWIATWVLQVMPVFFFVGGFANLAGYRSTVRRGGSYADYLSARVARLMRPTVPFVVTWLVAATAIDLLDVRLEGLSLALDVVSRPLWFLGVYLGVVALAPAMVRLHDRYRARVPLALVAGTAAVDVAARGFGLEVVGFLNFAFVWLFAHQLGFLYADGSLARAGRRGAAAMAAGGIGSLVLLTGPGPYPGSMVGHLGERGSNMDPPSLCIVAMTVWLVGIAMLARPAATRWLARPRPWTAVVALNASIMTVFLWHLTAMVLGVALLYPMGFPQPEAGTLAWWALRPVWVAALAAITVGLVAALGRFERGGPGAAAPGARGARAGLGVGALAIGVLGFAVRGFADPFGATQSLVVLPVNPAISLGFLAGGLALLRRRAEA